jgi:hypothetical protein
VLARIGPVSDARWIADTDSDARSPLASIDTVIVGFVRTGPGRYAELRTRWTFVPDDPRIGEGHGFAPLKAVAPKDVRWERSEDFDSDGVALCFDPAGDLVYFRAVNPFDHPSPGGHPGGGTVPAQAAGAGGPG